MALSWRDRPHCHDAIRQPLKFKATADKVKNVWSSVYFKKRKYQQDKNMNNKKHTQYDNAITSNISETVYHEYFISVGSLHNQLIEITWLKTKLYKSQDISPNATWDGARPDSVLMLTLAC